MRSVRLRRQAAAALVAAAAAVALPAGPAVAVFDPPTVLARDPDYLKVRSMIEAETFESALGLLLGLRTDFPREAEVHSLIGFSLRKLGRYDEALVSYLEALSLDPEHLGANEYLGELYVETGRIDLARERLAVLERVCGTDCEEYRELAEAIAGAAAGD